VVAARRGGGLLLLVVVSLPLPLPPDGEDNGSGEDGGIASGTNALNHVGCGGGTCWATKTAPGFVVGVGVVVASAAVAAVAGVRGRSRRCCCRPFAAATTTAPFATEGQQVCEPSSATPAVAAAVSGTGVEGVDGDVDGDMAGGWRCSSVQQHRSQLVGPLAYRPSVFCSGGCFCLAICTSYGYAVAMYSSRCRAALDDMLRCFWLFRSVGATDAGKTKIMERRTKAVRPLREREREAGSSSPLARGGRGRAKQKLRSSTDPADQWSIGRTEAGSSGWPG